MFELELEILSFSSLFLKIKYIVSQLIVRRAQINVIVCRLSSKSISLRVFLVVEWEKGRVSEIV